MLIDDREYDHHQHRWQNETRHGNRSPTPASQTQSDVRNGIARTSAGETLSKSDNFGKIRIRYPATLANGGGADLRQNGDATAEPSQSDFKKRQKKTAKSSGPRNLFNSS